MIKDKIILFICSVNNKVLSMINIKINMDNISSYVLINF